MTLWHKVVGRCVAVSLALAAAACGGSGERRARRSCSSRTTRSRSRRQVKAAFEQESGLKLTILQGGDAGEMVNRALLTKGNPQGDALFGDRQQPPLARARRRACSRRMQPAGSTGSATATSSIRRAA